MAEIKPRLPGQTPAPVATKPKTQAGQAQGAAAAAKSTAASQTDASQTPRAPSAPTSHAPRAATPLAGAFAVSGAGVKGASFSNPQPVKARGEGERTKSDLLTAGFIAELKDRQPKGASIMGIFGRKAPSLDASERNELEAYRNRHQATPAHQRPEVAKANLREIDKLLG